MKIFEKIRDEDVVYLNMDVDYARPKDLIVTHIAVPPLCIRPTVKVTTATTNEDDLSVKLREMMIYNRNIVHNIQEGQINK